MNISKAIQLALKHYKCGNLHQAEDICKKILIKKPKNVDILYLLGAIYNQTGKYDLAIQCFAKSIQLNPHFVEGYNSLGIAFKHLGKLNDASACFQKSVELDTNFAEGYNNLGVILQEKGKLDEAIDYFQKAVSLNPHFAQGYNSLGIAFKVSGKFDEAIDCFQKTVLINPHFAQGYNNLAAVFKVKGQLDKAIACLKKAIQLNPNLADAYSNLGFALQESGQLDEAFTCLQKALCLNPNLTDAHFHMSLALLRSGNFKEGWRKYEWRFLIEGEPHRSFPQPRWDGSSLKGKSLFIYAEQGVGDEIMFASRLSDVIEEADACIVECDKRLIPLFHRSFPKADFIERIKVDEKEPSNLPKTDVRVAIGSLPLFLRSELTHFPQQKAYLVADAAEVERWRKRYAAHGEGLKIGISWRGGGKPATLLARSISLERWSGVFSVPGTMFVNLQYGDCTDELKEVKENLGVTIYDWKEADPLKDLDGFAAQIAALDLVISVDNSTVHMAGALGVPVWTLLPFACEWRWMREYEDTPWYRTMRLFRQSVSGDWDSVLERIASNLRAYGIKGALPEGSPEKSYKIHMSTKIQSN